MDAAAGELWTDSHCHIQEAFLDDEVGRRDLLDRAERAGVRRAICIGTDPRSSREAVELVRTRGVADGSVALWASVGLHPHDAAQGTDALASYLGEVMASQGADRSPGCVVAVGECGLDYYYGHSPKDAQRRAFDEQIALAAAYDLTLVVHTRDAFDETAELLGDAPGRQRVVIHCFSGGPAELERFAELGCYISFSGIVTFKNAAELRDAARRCPPERMLVETDAPFLAPVPYRGARNEPAYVRLVGTVLAELLGEEVGDLASRTSKNAVRAFDLRP